MPKTIRLDNGQPFAVTDRSSVPILSLWLIGLGINIHYNRPYTPQENAKVERNQGTTAKWSDYSKCLNYQQLQKALDDACTIQREKYPLVRFNHKTRKELFPALYSNSNVYKPEMFSMENVLKVIAKGTYVRRVSKNNQISFYGIQPSISKGYAHQDVIINLDAHKNHWIVFSNNGNIITEIQNSIITYENIMNLAICQRTSKT